MTPRWSQYVREPPESTVGKCILFTCQILSSWRYPKVIGPGLRDGTGNIRHIKLDFATHVPIGIVAWVCLCEV